MAATHFSAIANESDVATLLAIEKSWVDAVRTQDRATLNTLLDDSFIADTPSGKENKQDQLRLESPGAVQSLHNLNVKVDGDSATVSGDTLVTNASGKQSKIAFVDTFVRRDGKWRVVHSYVTR